VYGCGAGWKKNTAAQAESSVVAAHVVKLKADRRAATQGRGVVDGNIGKP
jgi:hypothetical protein